MRERRSLRLRVVGDKICMKGLLYRSIVFLSFLLLAFGKAKNLEAKDLRIVSLAPNTTELLFALGLEKNIIGVDSFSDYPPQAKKIEKVGTFSRPNLEKLIYLKPDIVFTTGLEQNPASARLKRFGLRVFIVDPANIEELLEDILEVGRITDRDREARRFVETMRQELAEIKEDVSRSLSQKKPKIFFELWYPPLMTCGRNSYLDELITLAGGINIAADAPRQFSRFSQELVIQRSPDVIILGSMQAEGLAEKNILQRYGWGEIGAIKGKRVYSDINPDILLRPGPRVVQAIRELYKRFYADGK